MFMFMFMLMFMLIYMFMLMFIYMFMLMFIYGLDFLKKCFISKPKKLIRMHNLLFKKNMFKYKKTCTKVKYFSKKSSDFF